MVETRKPVRRQARGLKRMEEILDAAEEVIADIGYAEATTNAIAARAGMSPGSLYQFFHHKEEILEALLTRFTDGRQQHWNERLTGDVTRIPLPELVDQLVDEIADFKGSRPAYWALLHGSATGDRLAWASEQLHAGISTRVAQVLSIRAPHLDQERCLTLATMSLATVKAVMPLVASAPPQRSTELIAELKTMLVGYLTPALGE
ncbi:TetR/AcrR family transcriptional regulator [Herbidospora mongoliensis]|uniref:TetR/AcrR family transcriptional regulator n=1 Tax=Herbidospora mongoliensis TaxID=688067 RepID=UPI000836F63B|nr:TetR/AcrR family transcriptional regulator [Herbidospora mongoliensis]